MELSLLKRLNECRANRVPVLVATNTTTQEQRLIEREQASSDSEIARFLSGKSGMEGDVFYAAYLPPPRLVIIGAVHISQHMIGPAKACGFDVTVIDPRTAFASEERFAGVTLHAEWPDEILAGEPLDRYTALAALTHDPKIDDIPLQKALEAECFYVGALGSRKTHAKRVDRLKANGLSDQQIERIDAPIGLDIGAANPAEISVAVLGTIIASLRGRV
ncbi:MAG: XdhC family protein [Hyphomicrobiales bacterium]